MTTALQNTEFVKRPEYYCIIQRYNGIPILNALKNPTDYSAESFDVFYGPYYGDDGIRSQLTALSEKKGGKSFRDLKDLTTYFHEHWGHDSQIRIFDAQRGEIIIHGGGSEKDSSGKLTKSELSQLPRINLTSTHFTPDINFDSNNFDFANEFETPAQSTNTSLNRSEPRINFKSSVKPVKPTNWHAPNNSRGSELLNVHGLFGTKIALSRHRAAVGAVTGTTQAKPITPEQRKEKWF